MTNSKNTQTTGKKTKKAHLPEINLKAKGTLVIKEELLNQIDYLHSKVGDIEWSGVLLYNIVSGSIDAPATLQIEVYDMYLMDIGDPSFTEYDLEYEDTKAIHELFPKSNPFTSLDNPEDMWRKGMIHTHHSMDTFFSATDMDELHDNTPKHDIYLSLIVNKDGIYSAKTAFMVETSGEYKVVGREEILTSTDTQYLCMIDMDIVKDVESKVEEHVVTRYEEIKKAKIPVRYTSTHSKATYSEPTVTPYSASEFTQKVLRAADKSLNVVYAGIESRYANIGKMLKSINSDFKKASVLERDKMIESIVAEFVPAADSTKYLSKELTAELTQLYIDAMQDILIDEFTKKRKLSKQTFLVAFLDYLDFNEYSIIAGVVNHEKFEAQPKSYSSYSSYGSYGYDFYDEEDYYLGAD